MHTSRISLIWIIYRNSFRYRLHFLLACAILLPRCAKESIKEVNYEEEEFAPFVEPDFPFITTSLDARNLGPNFPEDNIVARGLAIRLGKEAYALFDTDMLRWSVAWTGDFLPMATMAQVSYNDFQNKDNQIPEIAGEPKIATGLYPGWAGHQPLFVDPRPQAPFPNAPPWGPIPANLGRWNGVFLAGRDLVMSYSVQNTDIYEMPSSVKIEGETIFTRNILIDDLQEALVMVAAEVQNGIRSEIKDNILYIYHGEKGTKVTAIGLAGGVKGVKVKVTDNRYATVQISPGNNKKMRFTLGIWNGSVKQKDLFKQKLPEITKKFPKFRSGGPAYWTEIVSTQGQLSPGSAAYVIDRLTLPITNPWKRNIRVVDIDFFKDNRAAVVTYSGDVWIVEGIDQHLRNIKWRRYASGLYEPMSIVVKRDKVYVFGKEGIVRFHDLNSDGVADYYENFSNLMAQSIESRESANDMVLATDGSFFVAKAAALNMGPKGSFAPIAKGFRAGSKHSGSILNVSADGRSIQYYATGLRNPFLGINPFTGVLSASDQQGHSVPSTPIMIIDKGDYYGVSATSHHDQISEITPPLVWIPHNVDRSGISQTWVSSDEMGPLSGELIHLSYGRPGLFKVLIDSTNNTVQGGVIFIPGDYPAPTMKAAINPLDGQLYATGFSIWGTNSSGISALIRLRYTGGESLLLKNFRVREGGVVLRFDTELDEQAVENVTNYGIKRWNYLRSEEYGSGRYNLDGTAGEEVLPVLSAHLSDDRHAIFLAVPNIEKVMQMQVSYNLKSVNGSIIKDTLWCTVNDVVKLDPNLMAEEFSNIDLEKLMFDGDKLIASGKPELQPSVEQGQQLFQRIGCTSCHSSENDTEGMIGPALKGLFGSEKHFKDGSATIADEEYIRESILQPGVKIVQGYDEGMPSFLGVLSDNEIESMTLYIKSLSE